VSVRSQVNVPLSKVISTRSAHYARAQSPVIMMQTCPKCGKANQVTRKFCIRCSASLLAPLEKKGTRAVSEARETGKVTTAASLGKSARVAATAPEEAPSPTTKDEWVRPSSVSRDRVRIGERVKPKSELDKAREAFARAEAVGVADEDKDIVETRMMRASEVKELLASSSTEETPSPATPSPPPEPSMASSSATAPRAARPSASAPPKAVGEEARILGQKSAFVSSPEEQKERALRPPEPLAAAVRPAVGAAGSEFKSSRYEQETPHVAETHEDEGLEFEEPVVAQTVEEEAPESVSTVRTPGTGFDIDRVTTCSKCGTVNNIDMFEYPREVYSAMGNARLSQARFFIVQGKYPQAKEVLRIAAALFTRAEDNNGLTLARRLADSLQREG